MAGTSLDILDILAHRRSVRRFQATPVPEATVYRLIAAAAAAPSAGNAQPWRFIVVTDPTLITQMADAVESAVDAVCSHLPADAREGFQSYSRNFVQFAKAPVVIVPIFRCTARLSPLFFEEAADTADAVALRALTARLERDGALASISMAVQNLLLAADQMGLGACVMTGPLFAEQALKQLVRMPEAWEIMSLVPVGFAGETPPAPPRRELARIIKYMGPSAAAPLGNARTTEGESS